MGTKFNFQIQVELNPGYAGHAGTAGARIGMQVANVIIVLDIIIDIIIVSVGVSE